MPRTAKGRSILYAEIAPILLRRFKARARLHGRKIQAEVVLALEAWLRRKVKP